jgi:hypothetical protein
MNQAFPKMRGTAEDFTSLFEKEILRPTIHRLDKKRWYRIENF